MALSKEEQRVLAEIERKLVDDDPVLASRLASFRLPRLALAPRSPRARLLASLLMLGVVAVVSVFVYALMPFRGQTGAPLSRNGASFTEQHSMSAPNVGQTRPAQRDLGENSTAATGSVWPGTPTDDTGPTTTQGK